MEAEREGRQIQKMPPRPHNKIKMYKESTVSHDP